MADVIMSRLFRIEELGMREVTCDVAVSVDGFGAVFGNVAMGGGAHTINQYLAAGVIDELRLHIAPVMLGAGEPP